MEQGRGFLESRHGVKTVHLDNVHSQQNYFAGSDERRLEELYHWLTSPDVQGLLAIRGGYGLARIYPAGGAARTAANFAHRRRLQRRTVLNGLYQDFGWVTFTRPCSSGARSNAAAHRNRPSTARFSPGEPLGTITDDRWSPSRPAAPAARS